MGFQSYSHVSEHRLKFTYFTKRTTVHRQFWPNLESMSKFGSKESGNMLENNMIVQQLERKPEKTWPSQARHLGETLIGVSHRFWTHVGHWITLKAHLSPGNELLQEKNLRFLPWLGRHHEKSALLLGKELLQMSGFKRCRTYLPGVAGFQVTNSYW